MSTITEREWTKLTEAEAVQVMREEHICKLRNLADGHDVFRRPLERPEWIARLADTQIRRRETAQRAVHSVLRAMGLEYGGTSGWSITAYVTPDHTIGLVNIADGVAIDARGVTLSEDVIEAATIPDQPDGCLASGAAAWTSPDAGTAELVDHGDGRMSVEDTGRRPSAPEGWRQLLVDVRGGEDVEPAESPGLRLSMIGLQTCYGETALPAKTLDGTKARWHDTAWWPYTEAQLERIDEMRDEWMRAECRRLDPAWDGEQANIYPDQEDNLGWSADGESARRHYRRWWAAEAARKAAKRALGEGLALAVREVGEEATDRPHEAIGTRAYDALAGLLVRRIWADLLPLCRPLEGVLGAWPEYSPQKCCRHSGHERIERALRAVADQVAETLTEGMSGRAHTHLRACLDVLYQDGPIELNLPTCGRTD